MSDFSLHAKLADDCFFIGSLPLCDALLLNDRRYPWCVLVPRVPALTELMQLDAAQAQQLFAEIRLVSEILVKQAGVTKLNVGALGNLVPQLHIHVLGRSPSDAAWPGPVWGFGATQLYSAKQSQQAIDEWRALLSDELVAAP